MSPGGREPAEGGAYQQGAVTGSLRWSQGNPGAGLAPSGLSPVEGIGWVLCFPAAASEWSRGGGPGGSRGCKELRGEPAADIPSSPGMGVGPMGPTAAANNSQGRRSQCGCPRAEAPAPRIRAEVCVQEVSLARLSHHEQHLEGTRAAGWGCREVELPGSCCRGLGGPRGELRS